MHQNLGVKIVYRNEKKEPVFEREYSLNDYCDMLREDLLRIITDVEDVLYIANDNKRKDEWSDSVWASFCKIKHKLLDKAGDIGRLPKNLIEDPQVEKLDQNEKEEISLSSFVAKVFRGGI